MVVYRLSERSLAQNSGSQLKHSSAGPRNHHFGLGAHGQFPMIAGIALIFAMAAFSIPLSKMPSQNVTQIIAGDNITISPENGYGAVTINSTGVGANGNGIGDNNVTKIVAGENISISPENGYGEVTITAAGNGEMPDNNVTRIIAGENITISPDNGYGNVTITGSAIIDNIRPSQLYDPPYEDEDGYVPSYNLGEDMFTWVPATRSTQAKIANRDNRVTTTSTTWVDLPYMNITMTTGNSVVMVLFQDSQRNSVAGYGMRNQIVIDGVAKTGSFVSPGESYGQAIVIIWLEVLSAAEHTIKIQWKSSPAGTIYSNTQNDLTGGTKLIVIELR